MAIAARRRKDDGLVHKGNPVTLNQLRAFLAATRLGSFTAAADELAVTQAAVSELVRRMEDEYGQPLFTRGARRLVLTAAGEELLPHAEQATAAADQAAQALQAMGRLTAGTAIFGMLRNAEYYLLSDLVEQFHGLYPQVRVRLVGLNSAGVAASVAAGDLEAGLVVLPIDDEGLEVSPWLRDEVLYASADPDRVTAPVTISDLAATDLVLYDAHYGWADPTRRQLAERAQLAGLKLEPRIEVEHVESALNLVSRGVGDTIVSAAVATSPAFPGNVRTVPFEEPMHDTIALIHRRGAVLSPGTRELARLARDMLVGADDGQDGQPTTAGAANHARR